jgi:ClpP class serine protease
MPHPHLASRIYADPWQLFPVKLQELTVAFERHSAGIQRVELDPEKAPRQPDIEVFGGVALAKIHGVLGRRLSQMEMLCGGFDTALFQLQLRQLTDDPMIHTLVIDFDSPGGMAAGNAATAAAIQAVSAAGKKVIAYASGDMCSAAYYLASAADEIHADPDSRVGSISTICHGVDTSRQWALEGRELKLFTTGKFKATGMDGKAWTAEEETYLMDRVRLLDDEFKGYVSSRRPDLAAPAMEGQWWYARHAPTGLIDSLNFPTLDSLLQSVF